MGHIAFDSIHRYECCLIYLKGWEEPIAGLICSLRIDRRSIPVGYYYYEIRGSDDDGGGTPVSLGRQVLVNHYASFISKEIIPIPSEEPMIDHIEFTNTTFFPNKIIYLLGYHGFSGFNIIQTFTDWDKALEMLKTYKERELLFDIRNEYCYFTIESYFITDAPENKLPRPTWITYNVSAYSDGPVMASNILDTDIPKEEPIVEVGFSKSNPDENDLGLKPPPPMYGGYSCISVEMTFSIPVGNSYTYEELNEKASKAYNKYLEQLKAKDIIYKDLIDATPSQLLSHGFVKVDDESHDGWLELRYDLDQVSC